MALDSNDEEADFRRWSDNILHWQDRPYVYPFSDTANGKSVHTAPATYRYTSMYNSDFVPKPIVIRRLRPTSINRINKPHPRNTFHIKQITNKSVPVVKTRMTLEELDRTLSTSPMISNSHRTFRGAKLRSADKAKPVRGIEKPANGIVPEMTMDGEIAEARLFPCIPRNARLTADRATLLTNSVIKPHANKKQPHLKGSIYALMHNEVTEEEAMHPSLPNTGRHSLKTQPRIQHTLEVPAWDGAPVRNAKTTGDIYGRKRMSIIHQEHRIDAVVPDLPAPTSKQLMFKEYSQYPKYAPQILEGYYNSTNFKRLVRPYVW